MENAEKKKRGRPKKSITRKNDLTIRLTDEEYSDIQFVADSLGVSRTDSIIRGIRLIKDSITKK